MAAVDYRNLSVLIADDFSNFRSTVTSMLGKLGVERIGTAANGSGVVNACKHGFFDVILCDYDLGRGKNGQQVLEELRHRTLINNRTLFIIISADASKDVVMASYDCEPDDYLMKPITARMLEQRLIRLLDRRSALMPAYSALQAADLEKATGLLINLTLQEGRHGIVAQKLLGDLFIRRGELAKAEKLYTRVLEHRQPDWAKLGLARVKRLRGETEEAETRLQSLVADNPLFLPAYDELANTCESRGDLPTLQQTVAQSVAISPKSILRQQRLGEVAERNGDLNTALGAMRQTVALGAHSCHANVEQHLNFARVAAQAVETDLALADTLYGEVLEALQQARGRFSLSEAQSARAGLLEGRTYFLAGDKVKGQNLINVHLKDHQPSEDLDEMLERIRALQTVGEAAAANAAIEALLEAHQNDEVTLQKLDSLLEEPVSDKNKVVVANINREGIDLYNLGRYDEAIACFAKARHLFPKHVGIQLNLVQTLVGKVKAGEDDEAAERDLRSAIAEVDSQLHDAHPQYARFLRLRNMAAGKGPVSQAR